MGHEEISDPLGIFSSEAAEVSPPPVKVGFDPLEAFAKAEDGTIPQPAAQSLRVFARHRRRAGC